MSRGKNKSESSMTYLDKGSHPLSSTRYTSVVKNKYKFGLLRSPTLLLETELSLDSPSLTLLSVRTLSQRFEVWTSLCVEL